MTILSKKSKTIFSALLIASLLACGCGGSGASAGAAASSETEAAGSKSAAVSAAETEEAASVAAASTDSGTVTSVSSSSEETLEETLDLTGKTIVACVGDSITWGFGPGGQVENNYPVVLGELLGDDYAVLNYGNPGTTLQDECKRPYTGQAEYQESLDVNADIYIFMLGTNDSMEENWDAARFEKEFGEKLDAYLVLESHPTVYVMTSPQSYAKEDTGEFLTGSAPRSSMTRSCPSRRRSPRKRDLQ